MAATKAAQATPSVKPEPKLVKPLAVSSSCGWQQESVSIRERQASPPPQDKPTAARSVNRTSNAPDAGTKARSRGGRGPWRASGGKAKSTKAVLVEAAPVRSVEASRKSGGGSGGRGDGGGDDDKIPPVPPPQECAEQKEAPSPDLSSLRKSPRSKEVRAMFFFFVRGRGCCSGCFPFCSGHAIAILSVMYEI